MTVVPGAGPLRDPVQLGPFRVRGRRHASQDGSVLSALAPDGRPVELVVLGPGPSTDAATRDRFAAAVEQVAAGRTGRVLGADVRSAHPWAALQPDDDPAASALARRLLAAAVPGSGVGNGTPAARGPQFNPYWHGRSYPPATGPASAPAAGPPEAGSRRWWVLAVLLAVLLLLLLLIWLLLARTPASDPVPAPQPSPAPTQTPQPSPSPSGSSGPPSGSPTGPGVLGPLFGPQDDTYTVTLEGLSFSFELPSSWGCMRSEQGPPAAVRWVCIDDRWILFDEVEGLPPGGMVQQQPCGPPCGVEQWRQLREGGAPGAPWAQVDDTTMVAEDVDMSGPDFFRIRLSHVFSTDRSGQPDSHVLVSLSVPREMTDDARKVVASIRANTP